jgi:hypothetical protein
MSISAISTNDTDYSTAAQEAAAQRRRDVQNLATALKADDLAAAQNAFANLQGLQSSSNPNQAQSGQSSGQTSAQSSNLQSLAGALKSGDLAGAQAAFGALQKGHHGHHHHMKAAEATATASSTSNNASDATSQFLGTMVNAKA